MFDYFVSQIGWPCDLIVCAVGSRDYVMCGLARCL